MRKLIARLVIGYFVTGIVFDGDTAQ
jgi:hypothetical protein